MLVAALLVPTTVGIAVLRYRLYEIDRLISRTVSWAVVTALLVAVFAGATNTPLACTLMAIELFAAQNGALLGVGFATYAAIACHVAWLISGKSSIYSAQR